MGTSGVHFANDCYIGLVRAFHSRSQPGQSSSHDDNVMLRNHDNRLSPAMGLRAFFFSLPFFYDKYKTFNYSNAFYLLSCLAPGIWSFSPCPLLRSPPIFFAPCDFLPFHSSQLTLHGIIFCF
jgi:hypothetical protein